MTQSNNGHTMTTHEALEVLKEHQEWRLGKLYMNATHSEITQALTIAIELMDMKVCTGCGRKSIDPIKPPALACCPDSNYIPLDEYLHNSFYDNRKDAIMKAYEQGWFDRDGGKSMYSSSEQYYNSITKTDNP